MIHLVLSGDTCSKEQHIVFPVKLIAIAPSDVKIIRGLKVLSDKITCCNILRAAISSQN